MTALRDMHPAQREEHTQSRFSIDCAGAQLYVHERRPAIVLRFDGEIDAANAGLVGQAICRFARLKIPLVIDLSRLSFLGIAGLRALVAFSEERQQTGLSCQVVTGAALARLTPVVSNHSLAVVGSVCEALVCAEEASRSRRRVRRLELQRDTSAT
jgi:anti-anti-sigma factor